MSGKYVFSNRVVNNWNAFQNTVLLVTLLMHLKSTFQLHWNPKQINVNSSRCYIEGVMRHKPVLT